ncbi:hypothetical protein BCEN4_1090060 [Burkholderia cenocepacia]|nr:hypothetical protein BCEN4_1090060 [Burkholderia cenocepacia]
MGARGSGHAERARGDRAPLAQEADGDRRDDATYQYPRRRLRAARRVTMLRRVSHVATPS